ncbi:MAG TPA: glycosyltransferase family 4 protein, partial [Planctomycetaceae bacterium]|nr:glycosyltransferase family 4 protein [Planctomycetaceae bacterium]
IARFADATPADRSTWGIAPDAPVFLSIGRLEPQKGMPVLLDAFAMLRESHPAARLLIVGEGSQRSVLESRIQSDPRLTSAVHLLGRREDIPALLQASTALVSASLWEGLPNVILEAFAAGRPVVATQIEGSRELVRPGETGWLAAPGSATELALAMRQLLDSPEQAHAFGQRAQQEVRENYSWDTMVHRYEELYERLLDEKRR